MMNRREFVTAGATTLAASSMLGLAGANASVASDAATAFTLPFRVIFDRRFADARMFAERAARLGNAVLGIDADIVELWYDELRPRLQEGPVALAGLTTSSALFCLQQLASNHWMKICFRAEHDLAGAESIEHRLQGSAPVLQRARELLSLDGEWRGQMANLVTQCPVGVTTTDQCTLRTRTAGAERSELPLVSWILTA